MVIHGGPEDRRPSDEIDSAEAGLSEPADEFGWSLSSGDFNRDGRADLAIGTTVQDVVSIGYGTTGRRLPVRDDLTGGRAAAGRR